MYKIPDTPCDKCGGDTSIHYVPSSGMDIRPTGMFRTCHRCGYECSIGSLDEKNRELTDLKP